MKLNFDIVCDALQERCPVLRCGSAPADLQLVAPRFYTGACEPGYLYLIDAEELPPHWNAPAVWLCGNAAAPEDSDAPLAVVSGGFSAPELMNALLQIFDRFRAWDESLRECIEGRLGLRELAGRGAAQIGCRILISDKRFVLLADSDFYHAPAGAPQDYQGEALPADVVRLFLSDVADNQKRKTPYLVGEDGRYNGRRVWNINIYFGDRCEGVCSLMEEGRMFRAGDFALFTHFFQYAYRQFQFFYGTPGKQSQALRSVLKSFLEQRQPDEKIKELIAPYNAGFGSFYCMILACEDGALPPDEYMCFTIESLFGGSISLVHDNKIVAFLPDPDQAAFHTLRSATDPLRLCIGMSGRGNGLEEALTLYFQAAAALDIGVKKSPSQRFYLFEHCAFDYLLEHSKGNFSVESLKTKGFRRLEALNEQSAVDYIHTLRVYLDQQMNSSEAAKLLFLHRSSFLKRLEHIRAALGDELETPQGRLLLHWLLYLIQE